LEPERLEARIGAMNDTLSPVEVRIIGALVEKQITTPDYYPLSLNALMNACNQKNNRDPVVFYDERILDAALHALFPLRLVIKVTGGDSRVAKYRHQFGEIYALSQPELAVMTVLMLRGPLTLGEIRGSSGRLHAFGGLGEVESTLDTLMRREPQPLVTRLPRQAGQKEARFAHLLSGEPEPVAAEAPSRASADGFDARGAASSVSGVSASGAGASHRSAAARAPHDDERIEQMSRDIELLRAEIEALRRDLDTFRKSFD
jgi:uncharacterized protein